MIFENERKEMSDKGKIEGVKVKMELESESSFSIAGNAASSNIGECSNFPAGTKHIYYLCMIRCYFIHVHKSRIIQNLTEIEL
ncbi:UNVERIFIED_CONTAM: hypothetical protein NCL1_22120 [Trichonephila clavipes]